MMQLYKKFEESILPQPVAKLPDQLCKHRRHNADFWNEVDKYFPDYQKQVAWLKEYGATLEL